MKCSNPPYLGKGKIYIKEVTKETRVPEIRNLNNPDFENQRFDRSFYCKGCKDTFEGNLGNGWHIYQKTCGECSNLKYVKCGELEELRNYIKPIILDDDGIIMQAWQGSWSATGEFHPPYFYGYFKAKTFDEVKKYYREKVPVSFSGIIETPYEEFYGDGEITWEMDLGDRWAHIPWEWGYHK